MQRIILHHTAGGHVPNPIDLEHYHFVVDGLGNIHKGKFPVTANSPGRKLVSGTYAAHVAGLNTGSIGISAASMAGDPPWSNPKASSSFPTKTQMDAMLKKVAGLSKEYDIPVTPRTVLSHAEVEITLGVKQAGKWDFDYDPYGILDTRDPIAIGDVLRARVNAYLGDAAIETRPVLMPLLKRGMRGEYVAKLQEHLRALKYKISVDGMFGPQTWTAVVDFQSKSQLVPDGLVGNNTWGALIAQTGESK